MPTLALYVGYTVIGLVAVAMVAAAALFAWAFFPARLDFQRDLPSQLLTPNGRFNITVLTGISSRRKARWHFGFMLLEPGHEVKVTGLKTAA